MGLNKADCTGWIDVENYQRMVILLSSGIPGQCITMDIDVGEFTEREQALLDILKAAETKAELDGLS